MSESFLTTSKRNGSIDICKGILIILVIAGHAIPGALSDNLVRFIIYSFHMPVFIAISGYLVKIDQLKMMTFRQLFTKYMKRLILPWVIAVNIYFVLVNYRMLYTKSVLYCVKEYVSSYVFTYYHLWYPLTILTYVLILWLCRKLYGDGKLKALYFALPVLLFVGFYFQIFGEPVKLWFNLPYFVFFVFGVLLRNKLGAYISQTYIKKWFVAGFILLLFTLRILLFFCWQNNVASAISFYVLNLFFIFAIVRFVFQMNIKNRILQFIGINSYPIYLYHVILILITGKFIDAGSLLYYIVLAVLLIILFLVIKALNRNKISTVLFGNI